MRRISRDVGRALALSALTLGLLVPASASAASTKPAVTTGAAAAIAIQTATLTGAVDPNGAATTYFFQYGTTSLYGAQTASTALGSRTKRLAVVAGLSALAPATTYHYRLIASNRNGLVKGKDRTLKTKPQPLGVSLAATPNPVAFGGAVTLSGQLTGTGNAGREIVLQSNPFPYTQGFVNAANVQITDAQGNFAFVLLNIGLNTQYRVVMPQKPTVVSPIVLLGAKVWVTTHVSAHRVVKGARVRFSGAVRPASPGAQVAIQRLHTHQWVTVAGTVTRGSGGRYSKRVRIRRGGTYRVYVGVLSGNYVGNVGKHVHLHVRG